MNASRDVGRRHFDLPHDTVWLDTAHQGALPKRAAMALATACRWKSDPSHLTEEKFYDVPERVRSTIASLLRVPPAEVVLGNSATFGLDLLARGLELRRGDEVLLVRDDFPATVMPWLPLRKRGVQVRFLPRRAGLTAAEIVGALRPETRVFCATWVDSSTGHVLDVDAVGRGCRRCGVLFVVNATQGIGVRPMDLSRCAADAVTCAGYKWLCGPYGTGFCWMRSSLMSGLRAGGPYWLPAARPQGLQSLRGLVEAEGPRDARGHDVFGTASFFNLLPWIGSLEYLEGVGIERIAAHNRALLAAIRRVLTDAAHPCMQAHEDSPIVTIEPGRVDAAHMRDRLRAAGIHVAVRSGRIRISPHVHNEMADVEKLEHALQGIRFE